MKNKLSGSYFTPHKTVEFMKCYLREQGKKYKSILEPSAGDGRFIASLIGEESVEKIVGVELDEGKIEELDKNTSSPKVTIIQADFVNYIEKCNEKFELVIGNPPYINVKNMDKAFLENSKKLCVEVGLPESLLKNSWVAFVLAALKVITVDGCIFFVLPKEFLQVTYAEKLREFLEMKFDTIHILTFSERLFPKIEQEACLVYLTNTGEDLHYIKYLEYEQLDSKEAFYNSKIERNKPLKKWSNAILSDREIDLLNSVQDKYPSMSKLAYNAPGIVTGANDKFILTGEEVKLYNCNRYVKPIISKGVMLRNKFELNFELINSLESKGEKVYLLDLAKENYEEFPDELKEYLEKVGDTKKGNKSIKEGYKCSRRKPWYGVPIVKSGKVIFFKRYDLCPRLSTNPFEIFTTDIAYNLQLQENIDGESLVFCFYNSMTLAHCEFGGRYYAGGVSELTPNEFRSLHIPYREIATEDITRLKAMFEEECGLDEIVSFVNSRTLYTELSTDQIKELDAIRNKLVSRRR